MPLRQFLEEIVTGECKAENSSPSGNGTVTVEAVDGDGDESGYGPDDYGYGPSEDRPKPNYACSVDCECSITLTHSCPDGTTYKEGCAYDAGDGKVKAGSHQFGSVHATDENDAKTKCEAHAGRANACNDACDELEKDIEDYVGETECTKDDDDDAGYGPDDEPGYGPSDETGYGPSDDAGYGPSI